MLQPVKRLPLACLVLLAAGAASGQVPAAVRVGVCVGAGEIEAAKAAGFDYVEINASRVAALTEEEFRQLADRVARIGVPVEAANIFIPGAIKLTGPEVDPARQAAHLELTLGRLEKLGVKVVVLGSGGARRVPDGFSRDEAWTQLVDFCRRLAPIARAHGITIAVEPLRRQETNIVNTAREGLALVKAVDRPEIQLLVDYYHMSEEGESADVLLEAGKAIVHTHIANPRGRVYPLDSAESNYAPFFENLCAIGYTGRLSIEASTKDFAAEAPAALAMLRKGLVCGPGPKAAR
ncbi:MAG TPA: sugar phosphate isomerase/epimerase family protein [Vicinamibacterales bacterium]|nr:sugar phosphate isomerase/epimerase family protein [Vicinamibacterales bacterium]HPW19396.1 sugar phosphate isomerase/epimerase family protein [Vicinamibacterales bacterium]